MARIGTNEEQAFPCNAFFVSIRVSFRLRHRNSSELNPNQTFFNRRCTQINAYKYHPSWFGICVHLRPSAVNVLFILPRNAFFVSIRAIRVSVWFQNIEIEAKSPVRLAKSENKLAQSEDNLPKSENRLVKSQPELAQSQPILPKSENELVQSQNDLLKSQNILLKNENDLPKNQNKPANKVEAKVEADLRAALTPNPTQSGPNIRFFLKPIQPVPPEPAGSAACATSTGEPSMPSAPGF